MSYNLANQMTAALGKSYSYDGYNRRVKVAGDGDTRYYLYSQSGQLLLSEDNGVQTNYIYLGSKLIAEERQSTTTFIHSDMLGSPVARTNSTGRVESRRHYQPFGDTYEAPSDDIGYTGHKYDNDLGLSYMQQRYYDPVIGRFYSNDPVDMLGHMQRGNNPANGFNRYAYANNNPYKYVDPDGEFGVLGVIAGAGFEVFSQVTSSMSKGSSFSESMSNLNLGKVAAARGNMTAGFGAAKVSLELGSKTERAIVGANGAAIAGTAGAATAGMRETDMTNAGVAKVVDGLTAPIPAGSMINGALENPDAVSNAFDKAKQVIDDIKK
nr:MULTISPECIES: RHS repeat-associated core domain-containing protein [unclassified Idiomarina]